MGKSALRFLMVTGFLMVTVISEDIYVRKPKTWSNALAYCRERYTDLSTISSEKEDNALFELAVAPRKPNAWIGLHKVGNDTWMWPNGRQAVFFNWTRRVNKTEELNRCVVQTKRGWRKKDCERERFHFYCFQSDMNLVKENLTWEKAMDYCRDQQKELVSLPSESALNKVLSTSLGAQTARVWTGLRYLADTWLWVGGGQVTYEAWGEGETPHCPALERHCGVVSLDRGQWESWDCADKLNFVCN